MLLTLYYLLVNVAVPQMGAYTQALFEPIMLIVISLAGLVMIFGAVGMKISNNLGSTVVGGIFKGIGYFVRIIFKAIAWIFVNTFKMIPRVFNGTRKSFKNPVAGTIFAFIAVILFVEIII